jgi:Domain of unknown function (DUF4292)
MKPIVITLFILFFVSCKTQKKTVSPPDIVVTNSNNKDTLFQKIQEQSNSSKLVFKTMSIRSEVVFEDTKQKHTLGVDIRMKKDEMIWINVKFLGLPMAKALITPKKVSYYEKPNNTYFDGDYSILKQFIGLDLDFNKVQNLLLGKPFADISAAEFMMKLTDTMLKIEGNANAIKKEFNFDKNTLLLQEQLLTQPAQQRNVMVKYPSYSAVENIILPAQMYIEASQQNKVAIDITHNKITLNENLTFPYSIPDGYTPIKIN